MSKKKVEKKEVKYFVPSEGKEMTAEEIKELNKSKLSKKK